MQFYVHKRFLSGPIGLWRKNVASYHLNSIGIANTLNTW